METPFRQPLVISTLLLQVRTIIDVRFPPTYTGSKTDGSNIALLKLEDSSLVSPIAIAEAEYGHHGAGIRIGLGRGTVRDLSAPFELQENGVVPKVNCEDAWNLKMFPSMSCVSARINETCRGNLELIHSEHFASLQTSSQFTPISKIGMQS